MRRTTTSDLEGRVVLITGANTGIGWVTARELLRRGARVYAACRSASRSEPALRALREETGGQVELLALDLGDLASVRTCAEAFLAREKQLDLLINNAGLAGARGLTASGFELAFGVHHIGHFLLTQLVLDALVRASRARVVTVASRAHLRIARLDLEQVQKPTATWLAVREYQASKLANVLFSAELGRRLQGTGVHTYSLHPGVVSTEIWRHVPAPLRALIRLRPSIITPEEGAQTTLYCATSEACAGETGLYYSDCAVAAENPLARDAELARSLWERSAAWTGCDGTASVRLPPVPTVQVDA